jgi:hypothetical protein
LIRNQYGQPIWVCRGIETGQFADQYHCANKIQNDARWPGY